MAGFSSISQMRLTPGATWAHRGGSANWPEMSAYAYEQSAAAGYGALEFSCARTSDGVWFGLHDATLNRTSQVTGMPDASSMTWAEVQEYSITLNAGGTPRPYMKLTDFLDTYSSTHVCIVDHKYAWAHLEEWFTLLNSYDARRRILVKYYGVGGGAIALADMARANGYNTWGYYYQADYEDGSMASAQASWDILGMDLNASQEAWDAVIAYGKPVVGHIAQSLPEYTQAMSRGADMVQCANVQAIPAVGPPPAPDPDPDPEPEPVEDTGVYVGDRLIAAMYYRGNRVWGMLPTSYGAD